MNAGDCQPPPSASRFARQWAGLVFALFLLPACQSLPTFPAVNFQEQGWTIQQGQAIWKPNRTTPELAGEILYARHSDGRAVIQFTKTPFPFVIAQQGENPKRWQLEIPPQKRIYSGQGSPPSRLSWLHLAAALQGKPAPKPWTFVNLPEDRWRLANKSSDESIEGFLAP